MLIVNLQNHIYIRVISLSKEAGEGLLHVAIVTKFSQKIQNNIFIRIWATPDMKHGDGQTDNTIFHIWIHLQHFVLKMDSQRTPRAA